MKLIITGTTGLIGSSVLEQAIVNPKVTSIVVLSRRQLSEPPKSPKVKVIIHQNFLTYPGSLLVELQDAEACIWSLGGTPDKYDTLATAKEVNIDYPYEAAKAFTSVLAPTVSRIGKKFQFWYVSGHATVRDQEKPLWLLADARKIKGEIENKLLRLEEDNQDRLSVHLARVGSVIPKNNKALYVVGVLTSPFYPAIGVDMFGAAMVHGAIHGDAEQVVTHEELVQRGKLALSEA